MQILSRAKYATANVPQSAIEYCKYCVTFKFTYYEFDFFHSAGPEEIMTDIMY